MEKYQGFDLSLPLNRIFEDRLDLIKFGSGRNTALSVEQKVSVKVRSLPVRVVSAENAPTL